MQSVRLSASAIKTYFDCQKLWENTYIHKLEAIGDGSFEINYGSAFHGLLEGEPDATSHFGPKWAAVLGEHYHAYTRAHASSGAKVVAREVPFQFALACGTVLHGFIDGIVQFADGTFAIIETKTTGTDISLGSSYWQYREQDIQVGIYLLAARECEALAHYNIAEVLYDVTRRPGCRQKRGESDDAYVQRVADWYYDNRATAFVRQTMTRTTEELDDLAADISLVADQIATNKFAKNRSSCYKYRRECGFYGSCFGEAPLVPDGLLYRPRKSTRKKTNG